MPYTSIEKAFCVLEYARTESIKTVEGSLQSDLKEMDLEKCQTKSKFGHGIKSSRKKVGCLCRVKKIWWKVNV